MQYVCQDSNGPLGNLKDPGPVQTVFPRLYFGQVEQVR